MTDIVSILEKEEGFVPHVYKDHLGYWTIGHGILVDERKGGGITIEESRYLLNNRLALIRKALDRKIKWWTTQPEPVQDALVLMAYQMGVEGVCGFKTMLRCLEAGELEKAAGAALNSRWAKVQTPARAKRVAAMIRGE